MVIFVKNQQDLAPEKELVRVIPPPMYQVVLLNDDFTPMDFVVVVLQQVFHKDMAQAQKIMLQVHHEGRGICGIYTRDVAETRVTAVHRLAEAEQHPLRCVMEPISSLS